MKRLSIYIVLVALTVIGVSANAQNRISRASSDWKELLVNGDFEGNDMSCFVARNWSEPDNEATIEKGIGYNGSRGIRIHSSASAAEDWETQFFIRTPDHIWKMGDKYHVEFKVRADKPAHISSQSHYAPGEYIHNDFAGAYDVTTEWQTFSYEGVVSKEMAGEKGMYTIAFSLNELREDNYYYFDEVSWAIYDGKYSEKSFEVLVNGNCEGSDMSNFVARNWGEPDNEAPIEKGIGYNGSRGIRIHSSASAAEDWETQFFIRTPDHIWKMGDKYHVEFKVRADKPAHISSQSHYAPGEYIHNDFAGAYDVTTEWQTFSYEGVVSKEMAGEKGMYTIAFNLNELRDDNYYYFDDMSWASVIGTYSCGLTINTQGKGTVTYGSTNVTSYQRFDVKIGSSVTLTFTPDEGYQLSQVLVNGDDVTNNLQDNTYTFTIIDSDVIVFATFTEKTGNFSEEGISYSILSAPEKTVLVNKNSSYRGNLTIPETVTHSGEEWKVVGVVANAFNNCTNLITISLPQSLKSRNMGVSLFTGCTKLAAITWNADFTLTSSVLGTVSNPNLLFYTNSASYAPKGMNNIIVNGTAERIVLQDVATGSDNFYCPTAFTAKEISYNHNYTMESAYGGVGGWETLALPFTVQQITHERAGDIVPFAAYDGVHCPFWLYTYSSSGFVRAGTIEANIPYIICMPNNSEYNAEYLLSGRVTFSAQNAFVASSDGTAQNEQPTRGQKTFIAAYKAKTREKKSSVYAMNVVNELYSETGGYTPGSIFISNLRNVSPFEAVMTTTGAASRVISLDFDETTGIRTLPVAHSTIYRVYNLNGQLLIQSDNAEEKDRLIEQLPAGVYIVNGKKMIINK